MLGLHLIPGALLTAFYFLTAPLVMSVGYPPEMALLLGILIVLIPFELGYLFYQAHKQSGRLSLQDIVVYREPLPLWQYFVAVPVLLGWGLAAFYSFRCIISSRPGKMSLGSWPSFLWCMRYLGSATST